MLNLAVAWQVLPREADPPPLGRSQARSGAARVPGKTTILVVDDEYYVRRLTGRMLRDIGYDVLEASSASEALAFIKGPVPVGLVLTDIAMPGTDGVRLAETIAERYPGHPVLLMSGFAGMIRKLGFDASPLPLLQKPFSAVDLGLAVRQALEESGSSP
jgi:CheY-like chemotaxis protein